MSRLILSVVIAGAACLATSAPAHADASRCFATWSEAEAVARKEALVAVEEVSSLAYTATQGAKVIKSTLCEEDGRYVYRLVLREAKGSLKTMSVDAKKPFEK